MKLNILPAQPKEIEKGPKYVITLEYMIGDADGDYYGEAEYSEFTPDMERFIRILQEIDKKCEDEDDYDFGCYFEELGPGFFDNKDDYGFFREHSGVIFEHMQYPIKYEDFYVSYLDENGDWHDVEIED